MNRCAYQYHHQQNTAAAALVGFGCVSELRRGEICSNNYSMANTNGVVCPKPRRVLNFNGPVSTRSSRFLHNNNQLVEACDSKVGTDELLDIIRTKGDYGAEKSSFQAASSPPFYSGSPPVRASNPVIQDEQFVNGKSSLLSPSFEPPAPSGLLSSRKSMNGGGGIGGGCVRVKYGHNQPPVRVEGFNCGVYAIA